MKEDMKKEKMMPKYKPEKDAAKILEEMANTFRERI